MVHELNIQSLGKLTEAEFQNFCMDNRHLRIERDAEGNIIIMSPTYSETGFYNSNLLIEFGAWNKRSKAGYVFDSSTGFTLPNSAVRSPDVSLILKDKWEALPKTEKKKFAHVCPDFVIEIVSASDNLKQVQSKMNEWISQGASLGWLIDFDNQRVWIYSTGGNTSEHPFDQPLAGTGPIDGFAVSLPEIMKG
ncbi:MAG: Uma2 family endonuclease [Imperialibacter sp.]|uniref:Uma2 family endonuclease n=1 Tax=Imperialibacter sp. TaxID=2038411 RepID=UPI003A8A338E